MFRLIQKLIVNVEATLNRAATTVKTTTTNKFSQTTTCRLRSLQLWYFKDIWLQPPYSMLDELSCPNHTPIFQNDYTYNVLYIPPKNELIFSLLEDRGLTPQWQNSSF